MLVDDSVVVRSIFQRMLAPFPEFAIVAMANGADQALHALDSHAVDIILLDVEMPGMDGLTALPRLLARAQGARVVIVSSACEEGSAAAVRALTLGAADTLPKPSAGSFGDRFTATLTEKLRRVALDRARPAVAPAAPVSPAAPRLRIRPSVMGPVECIAVGASTGGLHALSAFFRALPPELDVPILITQHLPASFMPYFAAQMQEIAGRRTKVAADGDRVETGMLLIAPGDAHLGLARTAAGMRVALLRTPAPSGCLPSVDPMLAALGEVYGPAGVGVVLSGMGRDGAHAARELADAGVEILVQDQASSVIWGMPGAIANRGDAAGILDPAAIARRIARRAARADRAGSQPWK